MPLPHPHAAAVPASPPPAPGRSRPHVVKGRLAQTASRLCPRTGPQLCPQPPPALFRTREMTCLLALTQAGDKDSVRLPLGSCELGRGQVTLSPSSWEG